MTEAVTGLAIPFTRTWAIVERIADIDQPGLPGVRVFEVDYRNSFDVYIRPQATMLSQPHAFMAEEAAALSLILGTIGGFIVTTSSGAAQMAATKLRSALGINVPVIDSTVAEDGKFFFSSEQVHSAPHQREALKARYWDISGQATVHEFNCVNVYIVESTVYLRVVDRVQEDSRQKGFRVDRLEVAEALDIPVGFCRAEPADIRGPHTSDAKTGVSKWASTLTDVDATRIANYEPVSFIRSEEGQEDVGDVFDQGLGPSEFSADVPMLNSATTISFILRRSSGVVVTEPLKLKNAVVT